MKLLSRIIFSACNYVYIRLIVYMHL